MHQLPPEFERDLVQVLDARDVAVAARIIEAAAALDDDGLRVFLELFAERVRSSSRPVRGAELHDFLQRSQQTGD